MSRRIKDMDDQQRRAAFAHMNQNSSSKNGSKSSYNPPKVKKSILYTFGIWKEMAVYDAEYTLNTANALWTKKDYPFLEEYLNFIDNYYMGKATDLDFTNPEEAAYIINKWVEENTGGKIEAQKIARAFS